MTVNDDFVWSDEAGWTHGHLIAQHLTIAGGKLEIDQDGNITQNGSPFASASSDATTTTLGLTLVDHSRSGAHSISLTTDGTALPAGMIGTISTKACAGNDARLSNARTPTTHASSHVTGGSDIIFTGVISDGASGLTITGGLGISGGTPDPSLNSVVIGDGTNLASLWIKQGTGHNQVLLNLQNALGQNKFSVGVDGEVITADDFRAPAGVVAAGGGLSVFGATDVTTKPTVSGSKGSNAALSSLLTALAAYGLITDSSS